MTREDEEGKWERFVFAVGEDVGMDNGSSTIGAVDKRMGEDGLSHAAAGSDDGCRETSSTEMGGTTGL